MRLGRTGGIPEASSTPTAILSARRMTAPGFVQAGLHPAVVDQTLRARKHTMGKPKKKSKGMSRTTVAEFLTATKRARQLFERVVKNGYAVKGAGAGKPKPLSNPDRRDLTEFIFFEVAAKFEQFAKRSLVLEVQKTMRVNRTRAEHMVGSSEEGIGQHMGGWAHVSKMKARATGLLGKRSTYARIESLLNNPSAQRLGMAVIIRNRIGHGKGNKSFTEMLGKAPVSLNAAQRKGLSPGRFLAEYPKTAAANDKWFFVLLDTYEKWAAIVNKRI